jgi:hypothetical protein
MSDGPFELEYLSIDNKTFNQCTVLAEQTQTTYTKRRYKCA